MKIVCFGDSLTARKEGYPKPMLTMMLSEKVKGHRYFNAGVSGNTTVDARQRFKEEVLTKHADIVTILFGSNDCSDTKNIPLEIYRENIEYFIRKVGHKKVILVTPPPVDDAKQVHRKNEVLIQYVEEMKKIAEEQHCECIDFYHHVMKQEHYQQLLVGKSDDGLHFGEKLYDQLTELLADLIKKRERKAEESVWEKIKNKF